MTTADRACPDALALYMRAVGEVPLLTPAQEIELAARIRRGDAAARDWMIRANLRFVIKIAREYEHLGMPLLDLINEGNIGLMIAVDRFDPRKGAKPTTYPRTHPPVAEPRPEPAPPPHGRTRLRFDCRVTRFA